MENEKVVGLLGIRRCRFCGKQPDIIQGTEPPEVCCVTEGCPAFSNVVSLEKWNETPAHEALVVDVPLDEPVFVFRAKDPLALKAIYEWIDVAERKGVNEEKLDKAVAHAETFQKFQRDFPERMKKLPD